MTNKTNDVPARLKNTLDKLTRIAGDLSIWQPDIQNIKDALDHINAQAEEITITDKLLAERNKLLASIPGCHAHGDQCVPHAMEWVERAKKQVCPNCQGTGEVDSGGTAPWGAPILVACHCRSGS